MIIFTYYCDPQKNQKSESVLQDLWKLRRFIQVGDSSAWIVALQMPNYYTTVPKDRGFTVLPLCDCLYVYP